MQILNPVLIDQLKKVGYPSSMTEITIVENDLAITFPTVFKDFLLLTGNDYDYLSGGGGKDSLMNYKYQTMLANKLLSDCNVKLPKKFYPFSTYSGDQFTFFYLDNNPDPAVYHFSLQRFHENEFDTSSKLPPGVVLIEKSFGKLIEKLVKENL
jgi:hypothetical protein